MKVLKKILAWIPFVVLFIVSVITLSGGPDSVLFLLAGAMTAPIYEWQEWLSEKLHNKTVKILVIVLIIALGVVFSVTEKPIEDKIYTVEDSPSLSETMNEMLEDMNK